MNSIIEIIGREALNGNGASYNDALVLTKPDIPLEDIFYWANVVREKFFANKVNLCAIVNARSGKCSENCSFCAQSSHYETEADVYGMLSKDELIKKAEAARKNGAKCFGIVTSGETVKGKELEEVAGAVKVITGDMNFNCSASLGKLSQKDFLKLKEAGLTLYHHNLETSERFFPEICSTHSWRERYDTIRAAKAVGIEVCSGGIFGLGENFEDRVSLAITLKNLNIKSVPLNFLNAIAGTPLENIDKIPALEILRTIAIFRLSLPEANIRICGGREANLGDLQSHIFRAGANGMMVGNYLTINGRKMEDDFKMLKDLGLEYK